jgi:hypothetical protein
VKTGARRLVDLESLLVLVDALVEAAFLIGLESVSDQVDGGGQPARRLVLLVLLLRGSSAALHFVPRRPDAGGDARARELRVRVRLLRVLEVRLRVVRLSQLRGDHAERDEHLRLDRPAAALLQTDRELVLQLLLRWTEATWVVLVHDLLDGLVHGSIVRRGVCARTDDEERHSNEQRQEAPSQV